MTPKEKANELANKMYNGSVFDKTKEEHILECENAKRCARIAIELAREYNDFHLEFLYEVEQEIEAL